MKANTNCAAFICDLLILSKNGQGGEMNLLLGQMVAHIVITFNLDLEKNCHHYHSA